MPIELVYATEGTPGAIWGLPPCLDNAIRTPASCSITSCSPRSPAVQQRHRRALRLFHREVKEKPAAPLLAQIKLLNSDPAALEGQVETIKKKYEEYFGTEVMTVAIPAPLARPRLRIDLFGPAFVLLVAVLAVLVVLPLSWLLYYSLVDRNGAFTWRTSPRW